MDYTNIKQTRSMILDQTSAVTTPVGGPGLNKSRSPVVDFTVKRPGTTMDNDVKRTIGTAKPEGCKKLRLSGADRKWIARWIKEGKNRKTALHLLTE